MTQIILFVEMSKFSKYTNFQKKNKTVKENMDILKYCGVLYILTWYL